MRSTRGSIFSVGHVASILCLCALAAGPAVAADNCADILKFGTFDTKAGAGSTSYQRSFRNYVCTENFSESGGGAAFELPDTASFSFNNKSEAYRKYCSDQYEALQQSEEWQTFVRTASETISDAWLSCMRLRESEDPSSGMSEKLLTFSLRQFEDPDDFEVLARYIPVDGRPEIPYNVVFVQNDALADVTCRIGNKEFDWASDQPFNVGKNAPLICKRSTNQSYDLRLIPDKSFDNLKTVEFRIPRAYRPVVQEEGATIVFPVLACSDSHCAPSYFEGKADISGYEGRILPMKGTDTTQTIMLPAQLLKEDISISGLITFRCVQTDNPEYGEHRVHDGAKLLAGGGYLEVIVDTKLRPDRPDNQGSHARLDCTLTYTRLVVR